jgi:Na+(H+)/acetate symporter ActP
VSFYLPQIISDPKENIISEDPTPAETSNQKNRTGQQKAQEAQSQMIILAALVLAAGIIITSIIVAGCVAICRIRRPKPEPEEVRKRIR